MLKEEPGVGMRYEKGQEYDVPDPVGTRWVRRMIAVSVAARGVAEGHTDGAARTPRAKRPPSTEE